MIKFQKIGQLLTMFLCLGILFSCNDDPNVAPFDVIGDVFVTKRIIDEEAKFANSYYAYGNQPMTFAQATAPDGTEIALSPNIQGNIFANIPDNADFTAATPNEGNYTFDVIHEEIQHQTVDLLKFDNIEFTVISSATMENGILNVEWEENAVSEAFTLRLLNDAGETIFSSPILSAQALRYEIDPITGTGSWMAGYPQNSDPYNLELLAYIFDAEATDTDFSFNIQEISISEQGVIWIE